MMLASLVPATSVQVGALVDPELVLDSNTELAGAAQPLDSNPFQLTEFGDSMLFVADGVGTTSGCGGSRRADIPFC